VPNIEVSAGIGAFVMHAAAALGAEPARLQKATGFDPTVASDPDARIPFELEETLWHEAARLTNDDAFGLHAARLVKPGAFGVLDYVVRTAPTLRVALERLARYNRLVHDAARFELIDQAGATRIEHAFRYPGIVQGRHSAEFTIGAVLGAAREITATDIRPRAVEFRHGRPGSASALAAHREHFGLEPIFARDVNAIEFDRAALELPVPAADPSLWRVIERHAEALLASLPDPRETTGDRVRRVLAGMLGKGEATLAGVSAKLHMSERSTQRKLADEGISFDALLDDTRRDLALRYLSDPKIAIAEVAYLLGFSEPSPFHRAFKRWTGVTPSEARRRAA